MKLMIVFEADYDVFDEEKMNEESMREVFETFHLGEKRLLVPVRVDGAVTTNVINADYVVSLALIEEERVNG